MDDVIYPWINISTGNAQYTRQHERPLLSSRRPAGRSISPWSKSAAYEDLFWRNGVHEVGAFGLHLNAFEPLDEMTMGLHRRRVEVQKWMQIR